MKIASLFKRHSAEDKLNKTLVEYQKTAEQNPNDIRIHVKMAELYLENGKKDEAIGEYLIAARKYEEKRLFQIAVAIYNHSISIDPGQITVYTELANLHLRNGFVGDGVAVLEKLANHYYEKDKVFEAAQVLKKIKEIDPNNEFFKIKVAKFYKSKDISEEETLRSGPSDKWDLVEDVSGQPAPARAVAEGFFDLASALEEEDDITINISTIENDGLPETTEDGMTPDEVLRELKQIMESEPDQDSPLFHYNLALAHKRCNQLEEAVNEFKAALPGMAEQAEGFAKLAECCMALERYSEAHQAVEQGLKCKLLSDEDKMELHNLTGLIYKAEGNYKKAIKSFKRIASTDKHYQAAEREIKQLSSRL